MSKAEVCVDCVKRKARYLYKEYNRKVERDHFTLVLCFSRPWCVSYIFKSLTEMRIPLDKCHLLIYDNTDNYLLQKALTQKIELLKGVFASLKYYKSYRRGGAVIIGMRHQTFAQSKLPSIQEMYKELTKHIRTELFINIEDDTYCKSDTIMKLLNGYARLKERLGKDLFLSGIESSRSYDENVIPILAVYWIEEKDGRIVKKFSADPNRRTTIRIHACGHYCFITTKRIWDLGWKYPHDKTDHVKHFAMDVFHTYHLHKKGVPVYADFSIRTQHMHAAPGRIIFWKPSKSRPMLDIYLEEYGVWGHNIIVPKELRR